MTRPVAASVPISANVTDSCRRRLVERVSLDDSVCSVDSEPQMSEVPVAKMLESTAQLGSTAV